MTLTDYEVERQRRIEENKRKLDQLCLPQMVGDMQATSASDEAPKKRRKADKPADPLEPTRRSKRTEGRERPTYVFELEREARGSRPPRDGPLVKEGECEELYGLDHVLSLGSHQKEWEMFTDGYNDAGERIYDPDKGLSCHQCRQKTLGLRTACTRCKSGLGTLCGDCLFARYGENVEEVNARDDWVCPCCRDLCNCSRHRKLRKWEATGQLHRSVKSRGYLSVAHYLVLNKAAGLAAKRAALASGFCPPDLAEKLEKEVAELEEAAANAPPEEEQLQQPPEPASEPASDAAKGAAAGDKAARGKGKPDSKKAKPAGSGKVAGGNDSKAAGGRKQKGKQREENGAKHKPKQLKAKAEHAGAAGSMGRRKKDQGKAPSPAAPPAAAAGVLETSGASGSGAVAPAAADGATARSTDAAPAVAAVVVAAADASGKGGKGKKPFAGRQGPAALQGSVLEVPARRRMARA